MRREREFLKMLGKKIVVVVFCIFFGLNLNTVSFAADKVGYINLQRLVNESEMGKAARKEIEKLRKDKEEALTLKLKEINELKEFIDKKGNEMDPLEKRDKTGKLKRLNTDYQKFVNDAKEDILKEDREVVSIILKKADGILKKVAKRKKFAIILKDPNAIGYLDPEVDITDEVLKELNKEQK